MKRRHIGLEVKLAATLLALGDIPYEDAKKMTAAQICSLYQFDHYPILHAIEPIDEPWNLRPMFHAPHREKSRRDTSAVAKVKRLGKAQTEHKERMTTTRLLLATGTKPKPYAWPKRKQRIPNRPWQKIQRSFPKRRKP